MHIARTILLICTLLFVTVFSYSQICNGSLGDPVVNIHFGSGNNPGAPVASIGLGYTYTANTCPDDGYYTVVNSTFSCFNNTWHSLSEDHTPNDQNGYMMLVNATFAPGVFYLDTVRGLCGGTTYEFAAWVVNMLKPNACNSNGVTPNLAFNIETTTGVVLGSYQTGNILATGSPQWKQYGFFFTTPASVSTVVLRLTNSNPGGCGNDIALDDITFRPCGPKVTASISGSGSTNADLCDGSTAIVQMVGNASNGFANPAYQWQVSTNAGQTWNDIAGANTLTYQRPPGSSGIFQYRLAVAEAGNMGVLSCRIASNAISVTVHELPVRSISSNSPVCEGQQIQLAASTGSSFSWSGPYGFTSNLPNPSLPATIAASGQYVVNATDQFGCQNSNSIAVSVLPSPSTTIAGATTICEGTSTTLTASGADQYRWFLLPDTNTIGIGPDLQVSPPLASNPYQYLCIGQYSNGCADTTGRQLTVVASPQVDAGPDRYVFEGDSTTLNGSAAQTNSISWLPASFIDNPASLTPRVAPPSNFTYVLSGQSSAGCGVAMDTVQVIVYQKIAIPNAFSPNGDGINDTWQIRALSSYPGCRIQVFDRFGKLIMSQTNYNTPWDGNFNASPVPVGVYYYVIDLNVANRVLNGSVSVLR